MDQSEIVAALVELNGGQLVGKTRLQKTVYLIESFGIQLGFDFDYHHYGPYSEELRVAASDAIALGAISCEWCHSGGVEYAVFSSSGTSGIKLPNGISRALSILRKYDTITLELAATADFLSKNGYADSAWDETSRRKASKVNRTRISNSVELLKELAAAQLSRH
jgi:uncharacterized protein YwgA